MSGSFLLCFVLPCYATGTSGDCCRRDVCPKLRRLCRRDIRALTAADTRVLYSFARVEMLVNLDDTSLWEQMSYADFKVRSVSKLDLAGKIQSATGSRA